MNLEEAKKFLGYKDDEKIEIKKLLKKLADLGPKNVVITDGKNGSFCFDGENYYKLDVFPAELVQKTGAGDAFATATLAGLFYGNPLSEAIRWGTSNSASVISAMGPQEGLLTLNKLKESLNKNPKIVAKKI